MPLNTPNSVTQAAMREARARGLSAIKKASLLQLIPATQSDQDFIFDAFKAAMKEYVQWAWGWDEEAQRKGLLSEQNLAEFQLVMLHEDKIGALLLQRNADPHYLRTIFLLPQHHRQGIGSLVIQSLQRDAKAAGVPLQLRVILTNPAQKLYTRLGFAIVDQDDKTQLMRWQASEQIPAQ